MSVSRSRADAALRAWADWRLSITAAKAQRYDKGDGLRNLDDDPHTPWQVFTVDVALGRSRTLLAAAMRLYMRLPATMTRRDAYWRRGALLEYIAHALDKRYVWEGVLCELSGEPDRTGLPPEARRLIS